MSANVEVVEGQGAITARFVALVSSRASRHCVCVEVFVLRCRPSHTRFFFGRGKIVIKNGHHEWSLYM